MHAFVGPAYFALQSKIFVVTVVIQFSRQNSAGLHTYPDLEVPTRRTNADTFVASS